MNSDFANSADSWREINEQNNLKRSKPRSNKHSNTNSDNDDSKNVGEARAIRTSAAEIVVAASQPHLQQQALPNQEIDNGDGNGVDSDFESNSSDDGYISSNALPPRATKKSTNMLKTTNPLTRTTGNSITTLKNTPFTNSTPLINNSPLLKSFNHPLTTSNFTDDSLKISGASTIHNDELANSKNSVRRSRGDGNRRSKNALNYSSATANTSTDSMLYSCIIFMSILRKIYVSLVF